MSTLMTVLLAATAAVTLLTCVISTKLPSRPSKFWLSAAFGLAAVVSVIALSNRLSPQMAGDLQIYWISAQIGFPVLLAAGLATYSIAGAPSGVDRQQVRVADSSLTSSASVSDRHSQTPYPRARHWNAVGRNLAGGFTPDGGTSEKLARRARLSIDEHGNAQAVIRLEAENRASVVIGIVGVLWLLQQGLAVMVIMSGSAIGLVIGVLIMLLSLPISAIAYFVICRQREQVERIALNSVPEILIDEASQRIAFRRVSGPSNWHAIQLQGDFHTAADGLRQISGPKVSDGEIRGGGNLPIIVAFVAIASLLGGTAWGVYYVATH